MLELNHYETSLRDWLKFAVAQSIIVVVKCGFCATWVAMAWWLHCYVIEKFAVEAWIPWILTRVFETVFDLSTLRTILIFLFRPYKRATSHAQWWQ